MSRNPKPTSEELRFVYQMILNGHEDSDILDEYARLYEAGQLMFPYRTDKRFVRECRKTLAAALEVSQEHLKKQVNPTIVKRREEHFADLADVAKSLLANGLDGVSCPAWTTNQSHQVKYVLPSETAVSGYDEMTKEQLASRLNSNMATILKEKDWFFRHCFIPHVKSELSEELTTEPFFKLVEEQPYKLIESLRVLAARGTFKGTCPVCKDWR
ncbi:hypothetical protein ACFLW7_02135 [Chloroflexota bacterium]